MTSDAVKIARLQKKQHDADLILQALDRVSKILMNPVVEVVGSVLFINDLANKEKMSFKTASSLADAVLLVVALQQIAPLVPTLISAGTDIVKTIGGTALKAPVAGALL